MSFSYEGCQETDITKVPKFDVVEDGQQKTCLPIRFNVIKPKDGEGQSRDQTGDAAKNMRYAATLDIPQLKMADRPLPGRAIICGGAPSIKQQIPKIKKLKEDPDNKLFALNWTHTWLLNNSVRPDATVFFEIDAEPDSILQAAHPDVTYYICSHCDHRTFDSLKGFKRVLWHSPPNSPGEEVVAKELFDGQLQVGGGISTFLRTASIALAMGYRNLELFGVDSSFPDDSLSTHVAGYETANSVESDSFFVYAKDDKDNVKRFRTVGYLALQVEEFKEYCRLNHSMFALRVHGDGLLPFVHRVMYREQYDSMRE